MLLPQRLAFDLAASIGNGDHVAHDFSDAIGLSFLDKLDRVADARAIHTFAATNDLQKPFKRHLGKLDLFRFAGQFDLVSVRKDFHAQFLAKKGQIFFANSEKGDKFLRRIDGERFCNNRCNFQNL